MAEWDWRYAGELLGIMEEAEQEVLDWLMREFKTFKARKRGRIKRMASNSGRQG